MKTVVTCVSLATVALVLGATSGPSATYRPTANSVTFTDPAGDGGANPDITAVSVANDDAGRLSLRITLANRTALLPADEIYVVFDADWNRDTGDDGWDRQIVVKGGTARVERWDAARGRPVPVATVPVAFSDETFSFNVRNALLDRTSRFDFYVQGYGSKAESRDDAPDGDDVWNYALRLPFALVAHDAGAPWGMPASVRAGSSDFTVGLVARRTDTGESLGPEEGARVSCRATIARTALPSTKAGSWFNFQTVGESAQVHYALCSWNIPRGTRGKQLRATATVSFQGLNVSKAFRGRIR